MSDDDDDTPPWTTRDEDRWPADTPGLRIIREHPDGTWEVDDEPVPEVGSEPVEPPPRSEIDVRELIRESRVYESTAGPPRPGTNENGPAGSSPQAGPPFHVADASEPARRLSHASLKLPTSIFSTGENCARNGAATAMRDLEPEDVADENSKKLH